LWFGLNRRDIEKQWLFERCREVQASPNGHLDLWAREHYKSTIITLGLTIQDILNDPEVTVGIFSHTRPLAKRFLRQIKQELQGNALLKVNFPEVLFADPEKEAPKWSEDDGIVVRRSGNPGESTVEAWGLVDGMPTGKHFRVLLYDDVVTEKSVTSPDMIEKTTDALALSYNLGARGGHRRFIGTRYHFNDSYRTVIDRQSASVRLYQATNDGTQDGEPVLMTKDELAKKRRDMGPYIFGAQMLLEPSADRTQGFKREWMRFYHTPTAEVTGNRYMLVDAANEKRRENDYTSAWIISLGMDGNYYILDMIRDRLNLTERADMVFRLHRKWKPRQVRYESYGLQADIQHIRERQGRDNYRFDIMKVGGQTPKNDRIRRLVPSFEQGKWYFPATLHYTDHEKRSRDLVSDFIEQEYLAFPVPVHDDMLDSLARLMDTDGWNMDGKAMELSLLWPTVTEDEKPKRYQPRKEEGSAWAA